MCRLGLLVMCGLSARALGDDLPAAAVEAARLRQDRLRAVSAAWKATAFMPKGGRMDVDPVGLPLPREDITVESTHRLVLEGDRFRVEHDEPGLRRQVSGEAVGVQVFDGQREYWRFYPEGHDKPSQLIREPVTSRVEIGGLTVRPLALWCRGSRTDPYAQPERGTRRIGEAKIDGDSYLEVRISWPTGASASYYLDPRRDYLVRRIRQGLAPSVEATDVEYRRDPKIGWVPERWTWTKTRDGDKLVQRTRAEITELRVNDPVPPEAFRLDPVPGEFVMDHDSRKEYRVRADGNLEELDPARGVRAPAEPARPTLPVWPGRRLVRYILFPGLLVAVVALIVLRRRRAHTPSP
jgi:hypothetical protein